MTEEKTALVITSIFKPNAAMQAFAAGCRQQGIHFVVVADVQTPADRGLSHRSPRDPAP